MKDLPIGWIAFGLTLLCIAIYAGIQVSEISEVREWFGMNIQDMAISDLVIVGLIICVVNKSLTGR